jgi:hypothetical protein
MALGPLAKKIQIHRRRANRLHRIAKRCHLRAAKVAKRALAAKQKGHAVRARRLLLRALALKARAARAGLRSRINHKHIAKIQQIRRMRAQKRAAKA